MDINWAQIGPILGPLASIATIYSIAKITSDIRSNLVTRGKNQADLLEELVELTTNEYTKKPHPLVLQAKFNGAFGSTPEGEEIRSLFKNEKIATFEIIKSFVRYLKYVAYDQAAETFVERCPSTPKSLRWKWIRYFASYLLFACCAFKVSALGILGPYRYLIVTFLAFYSLFFGVEAAKIANAEKFLQSHRMK